MISTNFTSTIEVINLIHQFGIFFRMIESLALHGNRFHLKPKTLLILMSAVFVGLSLIIIENSLLDWRRVDIFRWSTAASFLNMQII